MFSHDNKTSLDTLQGELNHVVNDVKNPALKYKAPIFVIIGNKTDLAGNNREENEMRVVIISSIMLCMKL